MANNYTRSERETTIIFNEEEKAAYVWTCSPVMMRKLDSRAQEFPESYQCVHVDDDGYAKRYKITKRLIRFGKPASEAQKERGRRVAEAMAERRTRLTDE